MFQEGRNKERMKLKRRVTEAGRQALSPTFPRPKVELAQLGRLVDWYKLAGVIGSRPTREGGLEIAKSSRISEATETRNREPGHR